MKVPGIFIKKAKRFFLGVIFLFGHFYAYSQGCDCPPVASCSPCQGGMISLTFRYNGILLPAAVTAEDTNGLLGSYLVSPGETFTVTGSLIDNRFAGNNLELRILGILNATLNTACGLPIFVGSDYGSFTVMAGESKAGGPLCCESADMDAIPPCYLRLPNKYHDLPSIRMFYASKLDGTHCNRQLRSRGSDEYIQPWRYFS